MRRLAAVALLVATTAGCQLLPSFANRTVRLSVDGTGTFDCGGGFHGCTAWLAVRPADWQRPAQWTPGKDDRAFQPSPTAENRSVMHVSGAGSGGPDTLPPGDYRLLAVVTETDDTKPWVLGTDEQPGSGVLTLTTLCEERLTVPQGATGMVVTVAFGPECSIRAEATLP